MLWYKSWLDTRWVFILYLALLIAFSAGLVLWNPYEAASWLEKLQRSSGRLAGASPRVIDILSSYQGYIWANWFRDWLLNLWPVFTLAIGSISMGSIYSTDSTWGACAGGSGGAAPQFTLSLPVTRRRIVSIRAATGFVEMVVLAVMPSLLLPALSPLIGHHLPVTDVAIHALLMTVGGMVFFSFSFLLATIFSSWLKAFFILIGIHLVIWPYQGATEFPWWSSIYRIMAGEAYLTTGQIPWVGLFISVALAVGLFYLAVRMFERRDF